MPRKNVVAPKADKQHRWSGHRKIVSQQGYVKIRVGKSHPLADPNGYAYEHLVVWCAAGNPRPAAGTVLHHRNEVRDDNRIENLEVLPRGAHSRHHNEGRRDPATGRLLPAGRLLDGIEHNGMPATPGKPGT
jgi:hypothetical protein